MTKQTKILLIILFSLFCLWNIAEQKKEYIIEVKSNTYWTAFLNNKVLSGSGHDTFTLLNKDINFHCIKKMTDTGYVNLRIYQSWLLNDKKNEIYEATLGKKNGIGFCLTIGQTSYGFAR